MYRIEIDVYFCDWVAAEVSNATATTVLPTAEASVVEGRSS